jgi:hypothetical protein
MAEKFYFYLRHNFLEKQTNLAEILSEARSGTIAHQKKMNYGRHPLKRNRPWFFSRLFLLCGGVRCILIGSERNNRKHPIHQKSGDTENSPELELETTLKARHKHHKRYTDFLLNW